MMQPESMLRNNKEDSHQKAIFHWIAIQAFTNPLYQRFVVKGFVDNEDCQVDGELLTRMDVVHHIPNGGERSEREAGKFIAIGVKGGIPDMDFPIAKAGYFGLWIELKLPRYRNYERGNCRDNQIVMMRRLQQEGYCVKLCFGYHEAISVIEWYMSQVDTVQLPTAHYDSVVDWENYSLGGKKGKK